MGLALPWVPGKIGEALPVAILEAAAGKPVVTARPCGAAEIVKDVVTGRLVPLDDEEALADAICKSLGDPEQARSMTESLRRGLQKVFTWRLAYQAYERLCRGG